MHPDQLLEQTQWDVSWVPPGTQIIDRPELLCVAHPRDTPTLNSVLRLRAADADLTNLLGEVRATHAGRTSRVQVPPTIQRPALERALRQAGYTPGHEHDGYVSPTDAHRQPLRPGLTVRRVDRLSLLQDATDAANAAFGKQDAPSPDEQAAFLRGCADPGGRVHRFVVYDQDGVPLTTGGMTLFEETSFAFLWGGGTVPSGRGRGAYSALVTARLAWARHSGIHAAGLYARLETSAPIVAAQGFTAHGRMTFWTHTA